MDDEISESTGISAGDAQVRGFSGLGLSASEFALGGSACRCGVLGCVDDGTVL